MTSICDPTEERGELLHFVTKDILMLVRHFQYGYHLAVRTFFVEPRGLNRMAEEEGGKLCLRRVCEQLPQFHGEECLPTSNELAAGLTKIDLTAK